MNDRPDACPECMCHNVTPTHTVARGDDNYTLAYTCPNCRATWTTSWIDDTATVTTLA